MSWPDALIDTFGQDHGGSDLIARHVLPDVAYDVFNGPDGISVAPADLEADSPVVISRSASIDMADMLGRAAGVDCLQQSLFTVEGRRGDAYLLGPDFCPAELGTAGKGIPIQLELECPDSPFGALSSFYLFDGESNIEAIQAPLPDLDETVKVHAPYGRLVEWIHDEEVLLGHLIMDGCHVFSEIYVFGYLEGWISAGPSAPPTARDKLMSYRAARRNTLFLELLDELDDQLDD